MKKTIIVTSCFAVVALLIGGVYFTSNSTSETGEFIAETQSLREIGSHCDVS